MIKVRVLKAYSGAPIVEVITDQDGMRLSIDETKDLFRKLCDALKRLGVLRAPQTHVEGGLTMDDSSEQAAYESRRCETCKHWGMEGESGTQRECRVPLPNWLVGEYMRTSAYEGSCCDSWESVGP